jgi:uncharacterized protein YndB with AHSA1/START domain
MTSDPRVVSHERIVDAPAEQVFALIAEPAAQPTWDGNDNLLTAAEGQRVRGVGDVFVTSLTSGGVRENHVVEFEEGRRIAWCHFAKARWRYRLTPIATGTTVTETFDWSGSSLPVRLFIERTGFPKGNAKAISKTLVRLQQRFATG